MKLSPALDRSVLEVEVVLNSCNADPIMYLHFATFRVIAAPVIQFYFSKLEWVSLCVWFGHLCHSFDWLCGVSYTVNLTQITVRGGQISLEPFSQGKH